MEHPRSLQNPFLRSLHLLRAGLRVIFEPLQMQKAMHQIETKLVSQRGLEITSVAFCCFNANKNLTMLKR